MRRLSRSIVRDGGDRAPSQLTTTDQLVEKAKSTISANKTKAKNANNDLIQKPRGRCSRDYQLFDRMEADGKVDLTEDTYNELVVSEWEQFYSLIHTDLWLQASIKPTVGKSDMDTNLRYRDQDQAVVVLVVASVRRIPPQ